MSQLSAEQIVSLNQLADALKGTTIEDLIKANLGTKDATDSKSSSALKDLEDVNPELPGLSAILSKYAENYVTRIDNGHRSYLIPSAMKMFHILNLMDTHLSDNYYARRSLPTWFPTTSRLYFAILWTYQIARVMSDNSKLAPQDEAFLNDLVKKCPPEKLAIPGPLMPFFKAVTASIPENKYIKPVVPAFPDQFPYLKVDATSDPAAVSSKTRFWNNYTAIDWQIPVPHYIAHLHYLLTQPVTKKIQFGADDSANTGNKTVATTDLVTADLGINPANMSIQAQLLTAPKRAAIRKYYPFAITAQGTPTANTTTNPEDVTHRSIFGEDKRGPFTGLSDVEKSLFTKLGINEPILVHKDLIQQLVDNAYRSSIPEVSTDTLDEEIFSLAEFMLLDTDLAWFNKLAGEMATYAKFFPESGTLADCSIVGPRFVQHIAQMHAPNTLPSRPQCFADPASLPTYDVSLNTSVATSEIISESIARFTLVNQQMYATHPWLGHFTNFSGRTGQFWQINPSFDKGTIDSSWTQDEINIKNWIIQRPKDSSK